MTAKKSKKAHYRIIASPSVDRCMKCKAKFKNNPLNIIYKDVVECGFCGRIWIEENLETVMKFS